MSTEAMDPDFRAVADLVFTHHDVVPSLLRLVARSGNPALQSQMLFYQADTALAGLSAPAAELAVDDELMRELEQVLVGAESESDDEGEAEGEGEGGEGEGGEGEGGEGEAEGGEAEGGDEERHPLGAKRPRRGEDEMVAYMSRPTKMRHTFERFRERFGGREVSRVTLGEFMKTEEGVLHRSSTNKLFVPPRGFAVPLFTRREGLVRLAPEWLAAWGGANEPSQPGRTIVKQ